MADVAWSIRLHTEHLTNVHPLWVAAGWLVATATTSLVLLVFAALELVTADATSSGIGAVVAIALGFWAGGLFTGFRSLRAPILHGIMIGLTTIVAWFFLNLLMLFFPLLGWEALTPFLTAALILVQMTAAVAGAWVGHRMALRGGTELQA